MKAKTAACFWKFVLDNRDKIIAEGRAGYVDQGRGVVVFQFRKNFKGQPNHFYMPAVEISALAAVVNMVEKYDPNNEAVAALCIRDSGEVLHTIVKDEENPANPA